MAAPATTLLTDRVPAGIKLDDGFSTAIAFERDPDISFWEKTVQPPGVDGGDAVDHTTMFNTRWRTLSPRVLLTLMPVTLTAAYDPLVYDQIVALANIAGSITVHFPDGSTLDFYGFLKSFEPQSIEEGAPPEANVEIVPTNYDPVNFVEVGPVMTEVAGT